MIIKAAEQFNLDLSACFIIGDRTVDIQTGKNCGIKTILVNTGYGGKNGKYSCTPDYFAQDLNAAVKFCLSNSIAKDRFA